MKWILFSLFALGAASTEAQVFFSTVPQEKINDWKVTPITFSLNKPDMDKVIHDRVFNGRQRNNLVIDVNEARNSEKIYNYSELTVKVYAPASTYVPAAARVKYFSLMPTPAIKIPNSNSWWARRNTGC